MKKIKVVLTCACFIAFVLSFNIQHPAKWALALVLLIATVSGARSVERTSK
jgi:hypothetical protein